MPVPPSPVSVTRRAAGCFTSATTSASSASRPTSGVGEHRQVRRDRGRRGLRILEQRRRRRAAAAAGFPPSAARAASIISRQVEYRSADALAIARAITLSSASGSSGRTLVTTGGGSVMWANMTATSVSRS